MLHLYTSQATTSSMSMTSEQMVVFKPMCMAGWIASTSLQNIDVEFN